MKKLIGLFVFLLLATVSITAQDVLEIEGKVYAYGKALKDAKVEVYRAGELVYAEVTKGSGKFDLELEPEQQYMVEVSAEAKALKVIWINTNGTKNLGF